MFEIEIKKKPKNKQISFRMNEDEYTFILQQSTEKNLSVTNYMKYLLNREYISVSENLTKNENKTKTQCNTKCNTKNITKDGENITECITTDITNNITNNIANGITRICTKCNTVKNISEFAINKTDKNSGKVYYKTSCKECNRKEKINK